MPNSQLKIFLYAGILLLLGVMYGIFFGRALGGGSLILPILAGCVFVGALLVSITFIKDKKILAAIFGASFLGVVFTSAKIFSFNYFIAAAVSFVILLVAGFRALGGAIGSLEIEIGRFGRLFIPTCVTALAILATFIYTSNFIGQDFTLSKESFRSLVSPLELIGKGAIANFSLDMSVPQLTRAILDANPPAELRDIPRDVKEQFLRESEAQLLKTFSDALGVPVSRNDSVLDVLYRAANAQLVKIPEDLKTPALFTFGFLVFLTIKGFGLIFYYPIVLVAWLIYKLLLAIGFVRVEAVDVKKESLQL
jgi:hypothetical protein